VSSGKTIGFVPIFAAFQARPQKPLIQ